ncbi:hypothetical protein HMPREF1351_00561 [Enterococcus faecium 510]|nr:hypothetical protein HMPREF1351_00561 [Enterococcus faecium 510]
MLTKFLKKIMFHIKMERLKKRKRLLMRINNDNFFCFSYFKMDHL